MFKVVSDRSTDINKNVAAPECRQVTPAGKIIYGSTLSNELIKNIRNGHKIYTLQGKKVKNIAGISSMNADGIKKRAQSNQVYYIRYEQDGSIKKK